MTNLITPENMNFVLQVFFCYLGALAIIGSTIGLIFLACWLGRKYGVNI